MRRNVLDCFIKVDENKSITLVSTKLYTVHSAICLVFDNMYCPLYKLMS